MTTVSCYEKRPPIKQGTQIGKLTVVSSTGTFTTRKSEWYLCVCECGEKRKFTDEQLLSKGISSCGCRIDSPTYRSWRSMIQRCTNVELEDYKRYGGRGIRVCERWESFDSFLEDMGERPKGLTLDRINVNGNYEKENCRWATSKTQMRNRRNNKITEEIAEIIRMSTEPQSQIANRFGVHPCVISRIKNGKRWAGEEA
jgi:hypothetical protein